MTVADDKPVLMISIPDTLIILSGSDVSRSVLERVGVDFGTDIPTGQERMIFQAGIPGWQREDLLALSAVADRADLAWMASHRSTDAPHLLAVHADGEVVIIYISTFGAVASRIPFKLFAEALAAHLRSAEQVGSDWSLLRLEDNGSEFALQRREGSYGAAFPAGFTPPQDLIESMRILMNSEPLTS